MQHDQSKFIGLRKIDRTRNARTPDRLDVRNMDTSMINPVLSKKKLQTSRLSVAAPLLNASTVNLRKLELENNNLESDLVYSDYVSSCAELILEKKIFKETEETYSKSIKNHYEETKKLHQKCKLLETKINDLKILLCTNTCSDAIQDDIKTFESNLKKHETENILSQLEKLLNRFNVLCCKNIILPNSPEELKQFSETLKDCCTILHSINDPTENEILNKASLEYENFLVIYNEIVNIKKIVKEKICNLQVDILKTCSCTLLGNNN